MDLNCLQMGTECNQIVSGESTQELVAAVRGHMRLAHDYTEAKLSSQDMTEMISGAIWQSSRPPELRTPRPDM
jgi:predicted small metal-binding protein